MWTTRVTSVSGAADTDVGYRTGFVNLRALGYVSI
jgi:hypothetical protein